MEKKMAFMQMVPLPMKEENKEDYEPKVVSFGPYHHGKEKLKFVEAFKPKAVEMFFGEHRNEEEFMAAILGKIEDARSCYLEEFTSKYTDEQFAQMMLRDACVILNYCGPTNIDNSTKQAEATNHLGIVVYANIRRDMYLLENQIPFQILEIVRKLKHNNTSTQSFIKDMERYSFRMFFNKKAANEINNDMGDNPIHLLEIFRRVIVTGVDHADVTKNESCYNVDKLITCLEDSSRSCYKNDGEENPHGLYAFRSVTDLKSKGIHVRASGIKSLKGIRFTPTELFRSAELKLPRLYVDMYTRVFFKNVMAFEFSPLLQNCINDKSVTAYVSFMKLLISTTNDVKELRENGIIINTLGSDDDVLQLYNSLNTYEEEDNSSYYNVKEALEKHYKSTIKMWMADFRTTYFNNPWTIIALVASLLLLCLDIVQTYYTIHPPNGGGGKRDANPPSSPTGP